MDDATREYMRSIGRKGGKAWAESRTARQRKRRAKQGAEAARAKRAACDHLGEPRIVGDRAYCSGCGVRRKVKP